MELLFGLTILIIALGCLVYFVYKNIKKGCSCCSTCKSCEEKNDNKK